MLNLYMYAKCSEAVFHGYITSCNVYIKVNRKNSIFMNILYITQIKGIPAN